MSDWGRCAEKGCPCPALVGARWCRRHWLQFVGDWPVRGPQERNVMAGARGGKTGVAVGGDTARVGASATGRV